MQKLDRLLSIVLMLHTKRVVRAEELARHFGVSPRTIYRDVNTLCEAGVPVASEAGVGYSLVRGYHLPPVMFTDEEASAVVIGTEFLRGLSALPELTHNAVSAVAKILAILPDKTKERIHHMQETTAVMITARDESAQVLVPTIFAGVGRQVFPQPPQLGSLVGSTQLCPHLMKPPRQPKPHCPPEQNAKPPGGALQALPHAPQLSRSDPVATH